MGGKTPKRLKILPVCVMLSIEGDSHDWSSWDPLLQLYFRKGPVFFSSLGFIAGIQYIFWTTSVATQGGEEKTVCHNSILRLPFYAACGLVWEKLASVLELRSPVDGHLRYTFILISFSSRDAEMEVAQLQCPTCIVWFF